MAGAIGTLNYDNLSGTFQKREYITGGTSGAIAVIITDDASAQMTLGNVIGLFNNNEEITGGTSGATADVNHPDGAVGVDNLVKNGAFVDNNDPPADWESSSTLTTEGSGQVGNCMMLANDTDSWGLVHQSPTVTIGKVYKAIVYFKKGTGATGAISIGNAASNTAYAAWVGLIDANWTAYSVVFTATDTTVKIRLQCTESVTGKTVYFDEISLYEIRGAQGMRGDGLFLNL